MKAELVQWSEMNRFHARVQKERRKMWDIYLCRLKEVVTIVLNMKCPHNFHEFLGKVYKWSNKNEGYMDFKIKVLDINVQIS